MIIQRLQHVMSPTLSIEGEMWSMRLLLAEPDGFNDGPVLTLDLSAFLIDTTMVLPWYYHYSRTRGSVSLLHLTATTFKVV